MNLQSFLLSLSFLLSSCWGESPSFLVVPVISPAALWGLVSNPSCCPCHLSCRLVGVNLQSFLLSVIFLPPWSNADAGIKIHLLRCQSSPNHPVQLELVRCSQRFLHTPITARNSVFNFCLSESFSFIFSSPFKTKWHLFWTMDQTFTCDMMVCLWPRLDVRGIKHLTKSYDCIRPCMTHRAWTSNIKNQLVTAISASLLPAMTRKDVESY